jgi:hypothetical protein
MSPIIRKDGHWLWSESGDRLHSALKVTHVEQFFRFYKTLADAEQA